jgi:hypothetical protein
MKQANFVVEEHEIESAIQDYLKKEYGISNAEIELYKGIYGSIRCSVSYEIGITENKKS